MHGGRGPACTHAPDLDAWPFSRGGGRSSTAVPPPGDDDDDNDADDNTHRCGRGVRAHMMHACKPSRHRHHRRWPVSFAVHVRRHRLLDGGGAKEAAAMSTRGRKNPHSVSVMGTKASTWPWLHTHTHPRRICVCARVLVLVKPSSPSYGDRDELGERAGRSQFAAVTCGPRVIYIHHPYNLLSRPPWESLNSSGDVTRNRGRGQASSILV
jgi:hypothetical protein